MKTRTQGNIKIVTVVEFLVGLLSKGGRRGISEVVKNNKLSRTWNEKLNEDFWL
jgi:hypothetical protein